MNGLNIIENAVNKHTLWVYEHNKVWAYVLGEWCRVIWG